MTTFHELGCSQSLCDALDKAFQITMPMPIQVAAYKPLADGQSAILADRTGSGKTLAYLLPLLTRFNWSDAQNRLLIVAPTQELALQIGRVVDALSAELTPSPQSTVLIGGANIRYQIERLRKKPNILIATPGRLLELLNRRKVNAQTISAVVFDEVDELLSDGGKALSLIRKALLRDVQTVAVSASPQEKSRRFFAEKLAFIQGESELLNPNISHYRLTSPDDRKFDVLRRLLHALANEGQSLVFLNAPDQIYRTVERLCHHSLLAVGLSAEATKTERAQTMRDFRLGLSTVLVTSDLAARGLDLPEVKQVIHLDFPLEPLTYVHRSGRTARGESSGASIAIISGKDEAALRIYERDLGIHFQDIYVADGLCYLGKSPSATEPKTKVKKNNRKKNKSGKRSKSNKKR